MLEVIILKLRSWIW